MAYDENKPQATDLLKDSQVDLLANFQAIKTLVDVNHETFGDANEGKHKFLQMPEQGTGTVPTAANEGALFSMQGPDSTVTELVFRREGNGAEITFTEQDVIGTDGYTRLPSGLLVKYGEFTITLEGAPTTSKDYAIVFPVVVGPPSFPVFTAPPYNIQLSIYADTAAAADRPDTFAYTISSSVAATGFTVKIVSSVSFSGWPAHKVRYVAIGI